jgi:hypothetical protein
MNKLESTMGNAQTNLVTPIINKITSDDICTRYPNLCNLCDVLEVLTPEIFESPTPVVLSPVYKTELREGEKPILWNSNIVRALVRFEKELSNNKINDMNQIPLVMFVNVIKDGLEIFSHSYMMFIIPNTDGSKSAYTMGLGQNKKTGMITIRSPDFNPYLKVNNPESTRGLQASQDSQSSLDSLDSVSSSSSSSTKKQEVYSCLPFDKNENKYNGKYIIKSVEPLTFQYIKNFNNFLRDKISNIEDITVSRKDLRAKKDKFTEHVWTINTTIPYQKLNVCQGENCASFIQKMSYKSNTSTSSVCNRLFRMVNNPSSTKSTCFADAELNDFITNVITRNNEFVVEWLLNLYNKLYHPIGGQLTRKKRKKSKILNKSKSKNNKYKKIINK